MYKEAGIEAEACAALVCQNIVNFVKSSALNTRLFKHLCEDTDANHTNLLYYTAVRWLSAEKFLARFFELRMEIKKFLDDQKN